MIEAALIALSVVQVAICVLLIQTIRGQRKLRLLYRDASDLLTRMEQLSRKVEEEVLA